MTENSNDKGFTINDRRAFNVDGSPISEKDDSADSQKSDLTGGQKIEQSRSDSSMPKVSFDTLVASLNASALFSMGVLADPTVGEAKKDLEMARYTIDLLEMLEEKTKGNLTADEAEMLKHVLYDLHMIYVREKKCL